MPNDHANIVARIKEDICAATLLNHQVSFFHGGTNSTRTHAKKVETVDISDLDQVIEINAQEKYALVEPNVSMDILLKATLKNGLLPFVVPEFPGITCGGAVSGASLESSSWKHGQFNDSCDEYEVITGAGEVIKVSAIGERSDLFYALSGAYGTLGLITQIKIRLRYAKPFVQVTYMPVPTTVVVKELKTRLETPNFDYIEAITFDKDHSCIITGTLAGGNDFLPIQTFTKATDPWFYMHAKTKMRAGQNHIELVPITDYIFRYNRGAFWMGSYFFSLLNLPNTKLIRKVLNPFMNTRKLYDALKAFNLGQYYFLQDFYCPLENTEELINFSNDQLGIYPLWLCPIRPTRTDQRLSPHYIQNSEMLIDVGIWGRTKKCDKPIECNKMFETELSKVSGRKMLYAHAYYNEGEFWKVYNHDWYNNVREKYSASIVFPNVWEKVQVPLRPYRVTIGKGIVKMLSDWVKGKNLNN